jgi:hydroxylamine reductase
VKGVGYWADMARAVGARDEEIDRFVIDALFATVTNVDFDPDAIAALAAEGVRLQKKAKELFEKKNGRAFSGFVPAAAKPFELPEDRAAQVALGERHGVKEGRVDPDILSLRQGHPLRYERVCRLRAITPSCSARNPRRSTPSRTRRWRT